MVGERTLDWRLTLAVRFAYSAMDRAAYMAMTVRRVAGLVRGVTANKS